MKEVKQYFSYGKLFRYVLSFAGKRKFFWIALIFISLLSVVAGLVDPLLLQFLIDRVLIGQEYQLLTKVMLAFIILKILALGLSYMHGVGYAKFTQQTFLEVRADLYEHLQHKEIGFFKKKDVGDLMRTLLTDVRALQQIFSVTEGVISNSLRLIIILVIMYYFDWRLLLVALILIPLFAVIHGTYLRRLRKQAEKQTEADVDLSNFFHQRLSNIFLVKLFSQEAGEAEISRQLSERYARENVRFVVVVLLLSTSIALVSSIAFISTLWVGSLAVIQGVLSVGGLIAVYTYLGKMFAPIAALASVPASLQMTLVSGERLFYVLKAPEESHDKGEILHDPRGSISFDHVTFTYPTRKKPVLKNCSFEIAPGETVGIVGASGEGKTTIGKLLLRFYEAQKGEIRLDHMAITDIARGSLRRSIGVVPQQNLFLPGTIFDNIVYATPQAGIVDARHAAKAAGIHKSIQKMPKGYDTFVGTNGDPLSEGERQRLSIARVLVKDPKIFIFDEPTAELDAEAEDLIRKTIERATKNKTALIIAHRFSSLDLVDRILVLKDGSIVEEGTFDELIKKKGEFARLYKLQKHKTRS